MDTSNRPPKQSANNGKKFELSDHQQQIAALEKQLLELRNKFDAGKLTSELFLKKKKTTENKLAGLRKKAAAGLKKSEDVSQDKGSVTKRKTEPIQKGKTMHSFNKRYLIITAAIAVIGFAGWGIVALIDSLATGFDIGMRAPGFSFRNEATTASLNDFKGKQVVLTFWDKQESCKEEASILKETTGTVSSDKTAVIIVNGGADAAITGDCIKNQSITLPVLPDPRRDITRLYGVNNITKTFFINEAGIISHVRFGSLAGKGDIETAFKAVGGSDTVKKSSVISNVNVSSLTQTNAIVTWTSNMTGSGSVTITDGKQMRLLNETAVTTNHMIAFGSLAAGSVYTVKIPVKDTTGKEYSTEGYSFRTLRDTTPPVIQEAKASQVAANSITVTWSTDEAATGQVEYGETSAYGQTTTIDTMLTTSHSITVSGLKSETLYHVRVKSKDVQGNEAKTDLPAVTTKSIYTTGAEIGKKAPDFSLLGIDGKTVQLSALKGKIVILQFFNTECRSCVTEMPLIRKIYNEWQPKGLQLFAITKETHIANLQMFANVHQLTFPILMDPDEKVVEAYRVPFTPYFVFIDSDGVIRHINEGRLANEDDVIQTLNSLFYHTENVPK